MAYCIAADIKQYLGDSSSDEDALYAVLIGQAQKRIDSYCRQVFEASADSTRYFDAVTDVDGRMLRLDAPLCAITTVTNGNGVAVASSQYVTEPRNNTPYYALTLKNNATVSWTYTSTPENAISIAGKWAYSTTAPDDVKFACVRLTAYMHSQKDSQVFDTVAIPEAGIIQIPQGIPHDVQMILKPYRRLL